MQYQSDLRWVHFECPHSILVRRPVRVSRIPPMKLENNPAPIRRCVRKEGIQCEKTEAATARRRLLRKLPCESGLFLARCTGRCRVQATSASTSVPALSCPSYVPSFTFLCIARITTRTEQHQPIIIAPHESSALRKNTHITRNKLFSSCLIAASP